MVYLLLELSIQSDCSDHLHWLWLSSFNIWRVWVWGQERDKIAANDEFRLLNEYLLLQSALGYNPPRDDVDKCIVWKSNQIWHYTSVPIRQKKVCLKNTAEFAWVVSLKQIYSESLFHGEFVMWIAYRKASRDKKVFFFVFEKVERRFWHEVSTNETRHEHIEV